MPKTFAQYCSSRHILPSVLYREQSYSCNNFNLNMGNELHCVLLNRGSKPCISLGANPLASSWMLQHCFDSPALLQHCQLLQFFEVFCNYELDIYNDVEFISSQWIHGVVLCTTMVNTIHVMQHSLIKWIISHPLKYQTSYK